MADAIRAIPDPEIPVISIDDLGIVRSVEVDEEAGIARVVISPTYSGCPAMGLIEDLVRREATRAGLAAEVTTQLSPAWTTDWMSEAGRERLREFGIAPPTAGAAGAPGPVPVPLTRHQVRCPHCGSDQTTEVARFGSTACKALRRCDACREPFDEFKVI
ncbi:phenylacetate-CoA oxygenase [Arsenicicoccus sp. oral taxon 190]|nr:phenylacetate-CoA oxygenase [Arsenicicoccus sp. oral taxon 190]